MILNRMLPVSLLLVLLNTCNFSLSFAMSAQKAADAQALQAGKADDAQAQGQRDYEAMMANQQKADQAKQSQRDYEAMMSALSGSKSTSTSTSTTSATFDAKMKEALKSKEAAEKSLQTTQKELADQKAAAEAERKKMQDELAAAKKAADDAKAKQAAFEEEKAAFDKDKADIMKKLQASEDYKKLSPEDKAKQIAIELAQQKLLELGAGKKLQKYLDDHGLLALIPADMQKKFKLDEKGGMKGTGVHQADAEKVGIGTAALGGLGGLGLGLTELIKPGGITGDSASGGAAGAAGSSTAIAAGTGEASGLGQAVIAGITLDLSKLTMPSLQSLQELPKSLLPALKLVIYASKPIANLSDQLLKIITTSMILKVQDSFNLTFAAIKAPKGEFNADAAVEQINAKIFQDCKDLKAYVTTFLDLVGDTKKKGVTFDGVSKIMATVIAQIKDNYETLFTKDIVAQLTASQQKVVKADLLDFAKHVNRTVQAALDGASEDVAKAIQKRKAVAVTVNQPATTDVQTLADQKASTDTATTVSPTWDALVNQ